MFNLKHGRGGQRGALSAAGHVILWLVVAAVLCVYAAAEIKVQQEQKAREDICDTMAVSSGTSRAACMDQLRRSGY